MADNLLALARSSASGLHNSGRGGGGRSYAPGTSYGRKIPGTKIRKGAGLKNLASKGRGADTRIRTVGGRPSHVDKTEAKWIDDMGPLGEAWVQKVGRGTINPRTGLPEYGWLKSVAKSVSKAVQGGLDWAQDTIPGAQGMADRWDRGVGPVAFLAKNIREGTTWKPNEGKWGIFGQTKASKERDKKKSEASSRHSAFEDFRRKFEDENIAGIFTEDQEGQASDDTDLTAPYAQDFNNFVTTESGMDTPGGFISDNDIADYTDEYDMRKEEELAETLVKDQLQSKLQMESLADATTGTIAADKSTGSQLSSGLFGMLTQSSESASQKGFAGSGDFAADFTQTQAVKTAEQQFAAQDLQRKDIERDKESAGIQLEQIVADAASGVQDLQDQYNQEFWTNMVGWDSAVNA